MAAPTLTGFTDPNPCPRVLVSFTALAAGTITINVQRTADGRTFRPDNAAGRRPGDVVGGVDEYFSFDGECRGQRLMNPRVGNGKDDWGGGSEPEAKPVRVELLRLIRRQHPEWALVVHDDGAPSGV